MVLLLQPERDDRRMYAEFLRYEGLSAVCPPTAAHALALAPDVDLIVTGILVPGNMDGVEFIERLRRDDRTKHIPVIVLTACAWTSEQERARRAGCDAFLSKPCLPSDLLREMMRLLGPSAREQLRRRPARADIPEPRGEHKRHHGKFNG
jgi:two-component system cell cycle response regulator DivK